MGKISVALATFNEEANIKDCLESVGWADEVVVADGNSTDKTREIAEKFGARVIKTTNKPIFHINKNLAIEACRGDWVLMLDADERVDPTLAKEMKKIADAVWTPQKPAGYWLKRKNWFLTRYLTKGGQYPDPVIRFFKRGRGIHPAKSVHEQIKINGELGWFENDLVHHASPTFTRYLIRENRYSTLQAKEMAEKGLKPTFFTAFNYLVIKPKLTFCMLFFRHKGFQDGFPGFVFAIFSGWHFILSYIKFWEMSQPGAKISIDKDWA